MGATHSVALVSMDGEEVLVKADILSAASVVWRERLQLLGTLSPTPRAEQNCSADDIRSFVQVISMFSQDAATERLFDAPIRTMLQALPLIHKYDCPAAKKALDQVLEKQAFPDKVVAIHGTRNVYTNHSTAMVPHISDFVTQDHVDYIIRKQELYGPSSLTTEMKQALVGLIYYDRLFYNRQPAMIATHLADPDIDISSEAKKMKDGLGQAVAAPELEPQPDFVVHAWRFTLDTQRALLPYLKPNF